MTHPLLDTYLGLVLKRAERLAEEAKVWAPLGLQQELWALLSDVRCVKVYLDKLVKTDG